MVTKLILFRFQGDCLLNASLEKLKNIKASGTTMKNKKRMKKSKKYGHRSGNECDIGFWTVINKQL